MRVYLPTQATQFLRSSLFSSIFQENSKANKWVCASNDIRPDSFGRGSASAGDIAITGEALSKVVPGFLFLIFVFVIEVQSARGRFSFVQKQRTWECWQEPSQCNFSLTSHVREQIKQRTKKILFEESQESVLNSTNKNQRDLQKHTKKESARVG
jgi:hypothetical protein